MKKLLVGLGVVIVLLVTAVIALPVLIPSDTIKEQIAAQVRDATGRELRIDGEVSFSLVPNIEFNASDLSLSNAAGMTDPEMFSLGGITVKIGLLPLLGREVVIDTLVIRDPALHLEIDKEGRPNWAFKPAKAGTAVAGQAPAGKSAALPFSDLRLGDVRIEKGLVSFRNASTGQILRAKDIELKVALADLGSPLSLTGRLILNDEPVTFDLSVKTPRDLLTGRSAAIQTALVTKHLTTGFDGTVLQQPVPGLDGAFKLDIASVGKLAAWLGQPLDKALPDPGPLKVRATFAGDGAKIALKQATIEGKGLKAKVTGSFDGSGKIAKVVLNVESGVLDIDRYLPPARGKRDKKEITAEPPKGKKKAADMLAALSEKPLDLSALRQTDADVRIAIGGIKVAGFEVGRVAFTTKLTKGVLAAELSELRLYGGNVRGKVKLDGSGDALGVEAALTIDGVKPANLAQTATGGKVALTGAASGSLNATARGASPRALAQSLRGKLTFALGGVEIKDAPVGAISDINVTLDLPGLESPPSLKGSVIYNKERIDLTVSLDPLKKVISGEPFAAKLSVATKHLKAGYDGTVQQQPVPGLDGAFTLDIASLGKLAAWLGQPLDKALPDPGPLKVRATFASDGAKVALKQATIEGKELKAKAAGSFDASKPIPRFKSNIEIMEANLNAYLPAPAAKKKAPAKSKTGKQRPGGWSEEPIDFSPLSLVFLRHIRNIQRKTVAHEKTYVLEHGRGQMRTVLERSNRREQKHVFKILSADVPIPKSVRFQDRIVRSGRHEVQKTRVSLAFHLDEDQNLVPASGRLFYFVPTTIQTGLKFDINGDFLLNSERTEIDRSVKWNEHILRAAGKIAIDSIGSIGKNRKWRYQLYNILPSADDSYPIVIKRTVVDPLRDYCKKHRVVISEKNEWISPSKAAIVPERLQKVIDPRFVGLHGYVNPKVTHSDFLQSIGVADHSMSEGEFLGEFISSNSQRMRRLPATWYVNLYKYLRQALFSNEYGQLMSSWYEWREAIRKLPIVLTEKRGNVPPDNAVYPRKMSDVPKEISGRLNLVHSELVRRRVGRFLTEDL
ncbi:MAG: AsmA family protein, partial [Proteobacteria bacterium]|nr:AsmA family protein [Pseudomonadota bacterium]